MLDLGTDQHAIGGLRDPSVRVGDTDPGVFVVGGLAQVQRLPHLLGRKIAAGEQCRLAQQVDFLSPLAQIGRQQVGGRSGAGVQQFTAEAGQFPVAMWPT